MSAFLRWVVVSVAFLAQPLIAKDCGVHGELFPIEEEDLLGSLKNRWKSLSQEELEKMQSLVRDRYVSQLREPHLVEGPKDAKVYRCFYVDPTVCADQEIRDHEGHVIVSKGQCFNPLETIFHLDALLFFDGSNPKHLVWARSQHKIVKWVLTKGRPMETEEQENHPVYFDQFGVLVKKFGIRNLPAKVSQDGLKLKIEEFPL